MKQIMQKTFLAFLFILPFFFLNSSYFPTVSSKAFLVETVTLVLGALFCIYTLRNKHSVLQSSNFFIFFGLYVIANIISSIHGVVPSLSFWGDIDRSIGTVFLIHILFLSYIVFSIFQSREDWNKIFTTLIFSNIAIFLGTIVSFFLSNVSPVAKMFSEKGFTFGNSTFAGLYVSIIFFVSLGLFFSSDKRWQRNISLISIFTVLLNPIITGILFEKHLVGQARASFVAILAGSLVFVLYLFFRKIKEVKWRKIFIGVCVAVFALSGLFVAVKPSFVKDLMIRNEGANRLVFWNIATEGFKEKPILGWGGSTYHLVYSKYFDPVITTPGYNPEYWVDRSHNIYFDELVSTGIIGLVVLLLFYGAICLGLVKKAYQEFDNKNGYMYAGLFSGMAAFLLQGILIFQMVVGWVLVAILSAYVARFCFKVNEKQISPNNLFFKNKNLLSFVTVIIFSSGFVFCVIKPYKISHELTILFNQNVTSSEQRMEFYKDIQGSYVGNTSDLGDVFLSFFKQFRNVIGNSDFSENVVNGALTEIESVNNLLENSLQKEKYMDTKVLMAQIEFYSLRTILVDGRPDQKVFYEKGMSYVEKMRAVSGVNPMLKNAEKLMEFSIK